MLTNKPLKEETYDQKLIDAIAEKIKICIKEVLTATETAQYMGISMSYLYKLTMRQQIPHFKPMGKVCYFNRLEIEKWLQRNRVATDNDINERANNYCNKGGKL